MIKLITGCSLKIYIMKIYLAGKWGDKIHISDIKNKLLDKGHDIVSTWIERETGEREPNTMGMHAETDINEVLDSDVLVCVMTDDKYAYRGTFTEIGCALGRDIPTVILSSAGESFCKTNVFFWHRSITHVSSVDDLLKHLATRA